MTQPRLRPGQCSHDVRITHQMQRSMETQKTNTGHEYAVCSKAAPRQQQQMLVYMSGRHTVRGHTVQGLLIGVCLWRHRARTEHSPTQDPERTPWTRTPSCNSHLPFKIEAEALACWNAHHRLMPGRESHQTHAELLVRASERPKALDRCEGRRGE